MFLRTSIAGTIQKSELFIRGQVETALLKLDNLADGCIDSDAVFCSGLSSTGYMAEDCSFLPEKCTSVRKGR